MTIRCLLFLFIIRLVLICNSIVLINGEPLKGGNISPANPNEFPFVASFGIKDHDTIVQGSHFCAGVLISRKHVLTAAHCFQILGTYNVGVVIGEVDLRIAYVVYEIDWWTTYEGWAEKRKITVEYDTNDIGIAKLSSTVDQAGVTPVAMTRLNVKQLYRKDAVIMGWGITDEGKLADVLQTAPVRILTHAKCEDRIKLITDQSTFVPRNYICTVANPYTITGCGDSGGPLLDKNNQLVGITRSVCPNTQWGNFTEDFINQYKINVHSSVDYYRNFIQDVAKPHQPRLIQY